jgi:glycine betaine/proline transport system substrate-binding protein
MKNKSYIMRLLALLAALTLVVAACGGDDDDAGDDAGGDDTATTAAADDGDDTADDSGDDGGDEMAMPGEGVAVTMGRANWASGYFQAAVYRQLLEELGYEVSNPADQEVDPSLGYLAMAQGDMDLWVNSWYPGHFAWHEAELPDGSLVGDHIDVVGSVYQGGGIQGYLIEKGFADEFGITTMDEFNANPDAIAAYDAEDPVPGNGIADIYGCPESFTCDNIIQNQIAFGNGSEPWENITQVIAGYDAMFAEAVSKVEEGTPAIIYTWTPTAYITQLRPGDNVYWLGTEAVLDDSNPADQEGGAEHQQVTGPGGTTPFLPIPPEQCPAAANTSDGLCPLGWLPATVTPTANNEFLANNPAAAALLELVALPVVDVSLATVEIEAAGGAEDTVVEQASNWIENNRAIVDPWLQEAAAAG